MGYKDIGYRIQIAREEAGMNQKELSERLRISQSTLSNYEKGKRRLYLAQLQEIADALGRPIEHFLQPLEPPFSQLFSAENRKDETQELHKIIGELAELAPEDRKSAIDFIKWLRFRREKRQP